MPAAEPFDQFLSRLASSQPEDYALLLEQAALKWNLTEEQSLAEFARIKDYLLRFYDGIVPVQSFADASGAAVDCVPFEQVPSVRSARAAGTPVERTPRCPPAIEGVKYDEPPEKLHPVCGEGTVPLPRLTLERLIPFGTLENSLRRGRVVQLPEGGGFDEPN